MNRLKSGFTMVELLIVISIIGILALIAIPNLQKLRSRSKAGVFITHLKAYENALFMYCQDTGHYPPETDAGNDPGFLTNVNSDAKWRGPYMKKSQFNPQNTSIGGVWDWDNFENNASFSKSYYTYGIAVHYGTSDTTALDTDAALFVDRLMDDGNLSTGKWRAYSDMSEYVYTLKGSDDCSNVAVTPSSNDDDGNGNGNGNGNNGDGNGCS